MSLVSVLEPDCTSRRVVLPPGAWADLFDLRRAFTGPGELEMPVGPDDIPVFVHPGDATTDASKDYRLASSISRPADNCLALARLIVRGIFEQFPKLKLMIGSELVSSTCNAASSSPELLSVSAAITK